MCETINCATIKKYHEVFANETKYLIADEAIKEVFAKYPRNCDLKEVIIKISVLNSLYYSGIMNIHVVELAEYIMSEELRFDERLHKGDFSLVNDIGSRQFTYNSIKGTKRSKRYFVFGAKYCAWHDLERFPILDNRTINEIYLINREMHFKNMKKNDLNVYQFYKETIDEFRAKFGLQEYGYKIIDEFLWVRNQRRGAGLPLGI